MCTTAPDLVKEGTGQTVEYELKTKKSLSNRPPSMSYGLNISGSGAEPRALDVPPSYCWEWLERFFTWIGLILILFYLLLFHLSAQSLGGDALWPLLPLQTPCSICAKLNVESPVQSHLYPFYGNMQKIFIHPRHFPFGSSKT